MLIRLWHIKANINEGMLYQVFDHAQLHVVSQFTDHSYLLQDSIPASILLPRLYLFQFVSLPFPQPPTRPPAGLNPLSPPLPPSPPPPSPFYPCGPLPCTLQTQARLATPQPGLARWCRKGRVSSNWGAVQAKAGQQGCAKWLPCMKTMASWAPST